MHHQHRFRARGQRFFKGFGVQAQGFINVSKNRYRTCRHHRFDRRHKGERWNYDFIPHTHTAGSQCNGKGRGSAGTEMAMACSDFFGQFLFKGSGLPVIVSSLIKTVSKQYA